MHYDWSANDLVWQQMSSYVKRRMFILINLLVNSVLCCYRDCPTREVLGAASAISNATSGCAAAILSVQASPPHTVKNWRSPLENISEISHSIFFRVIYGSGNGLKKYLIEFYAREYLS